VAGGSTQSAAGGSLCLTIQRCDRENREKLPIRGLVSVEYNEATELLLGESMQIRVEFLSRSLWHNATDRLVMVHRQESQFSSPVGETAFFDSHPCKIPVSRSPQNEQQQLKHINLPTSNRQNGGNGGAF